MGESEVLVEVGVAGADVDAASDDTNDSRQIAAGLMLVNADGSSWELALQAAKVNREGANPVHSVSLVPEDIASVVSVSVLRSASRRRAANA